MRIRHAVLACAAAATVLVCLSGCAASAAPADSAAPAPTVTVTVTPAVESRSYESPLTATDAWQLCWGATFGTYQDSSSVLSYTPTSPSGADTVTDRGDGSFEVLVALTSSGSGAEAICVASGTIGDPSVELQGGRDFG